MSWMVTKNNSSLRTLLRVLALLPILWAGAAAGAAQPQTSPTQAWRPPDPLELKDQEIGLLKRQLAQARQQGGLDHVGRIVYETQLRVAALHAFAVKDVVEYAPLTRAIMDRLVESSVKGQYPGRSLEHYVWLNQLFAALPQPFDLPATIRDLMGEQAAGVYDPHTKKLYVKTDFPLESPMGAIILSHEICHAYQDQNFSLLDMGAEDTTNGDLALATLSLAEGDATLLMGEYFARYGNPADLITALPGMMTMDQQKLEAAPLSMQEALVFPYLKGMAFFKALNGRTRKHPQARAGADPGWRNEVFLDPPTTTEQILHPDMYLANKLPARVETPKFEQAGPATVNVAGEFGALTLLKPLLGEDRAARAAAGWNGDKLAVADAPDGKRRLVRWVTRWDTPRDADEFAAALEAVFTARFPGQVTWQGDAKNRQASASPLQLKLTRTGADAVDFQGSFAQAAPFPKVKLQPATSPLPKL